MVILKLTPQLILDWSEVWALLIPLVILLIKSKQPPLLKPVIVYLCLAFILNLSADLIGDFYKQLPSWLQSNNLLYNIHSLIRFACFAYFFHSLQQPFFTLAKKMIPVVFTAFVVINFSVFENFSNPEQLSGSLLATESYLLLIYCMFYYLGQLKGEVEALSTLKDFWVVTALSIYVVVNFFVFLFYNPLIDQDWKLAVRMWNVHNIAYIIFCILIAKAFYVPVRN